MSNIYSSISLKEESYPVLYSTDENDPTKIVDPVVDLVTDVYSRASDPAIADDDLDSTARAVRAEWDQSNFREKFSRGELQLVIAESSNNGRLMSSPEIIDAVNAATTQLNEVNEQSYRQPRVLVDPSQQEAARYDRTIDSIILNTAQLENPDMAAIDAAMQVRYDRSSETLRAELTQETGKFLEDNLPSASVRAGNRYRTAANAARDELIEQGVPADDPRVTEAMVAAAQPILSEHVARNPNNAREISKERAKLFAEEGTVLVTPDNYPELYREAREGTELLNAQYGLSYQPPMIVIKEGHAKDGSPASYMPDSDTIIFDADYVRSNPRGIVGILGHELDHRYPNPEQQREALISEFSGQPGQPSQRVELYEANRNEELRADRSGALVAGDGDIVAGAAIMKDGLTDALIQTNAYAEPILQRLRSEQEQDQRPASPEPANTEQTNDSPRVERSSHPTNDIRLAALDAIIREAQLSTNLSHDAGAPPHDAATSAPPAVQNDKPVQTQVDGVGGR